MNKFDNTNRIVNFSNSILKHFGAPTWHNTIPEIDKILEGHKKVVVVLLDGLGKYIRELHPKASKFLNDHEVHIMDATFPPTTVASTNGFLTGQYPIENGWMSWTQYFEKYDLNINVFTNRCNETNDLIKPKEQNILSEICPLNTIFDQMHKVNPKMYAAPIFKYPLVKDSPKTLWGTVKRISKTLHSNEECFIYYYNPSPDHEIHEYGVHHKKVDKMIKKEVRFVQKLVKKNPDTLFLCIADHGLIDIDYHDINEHPDLVALLKRPFSMEKRCPTFYLKEGKEKEFETLFKEYYGKHFDLYSNKEVLEYEIFGSGVQNPNTKQFIGDFLAISKDSYSIYDSKAPYYHLHKATHAGGTKEESIIAVSAFNI